MKKIALSSILFSNFLNKIKTTQILTFVIICFCLGSRVFSQTTLLSPTGDGGFETGSTFAANGWTAVSATNNFWEIGTVATQYAGSKGVYVANAAGTYAYSTTTIRTSHFYRDINIPACATSVTLSFYWKGKGESGWDRGLVYTAPTTVTPVFNSPVSSSTTMTGATLQWTQPNFAQTTYTQATITGLDALAGTTVRFIFTWQNDGSSGTSPGTAIDNISLTYLSTPAITTPTSAFVLATSAVLGGNITSVGCSNVTERGVYYSTTNGFADGTGTKVSETPGPYSAGVFTENVTGLTPSTIYYYKAFATNSSGTLYTTQGTFTTPAAPSVFLNATSATTYGEYTTVKGAFDAINAGTHSGVITITLGNASGQTITETAQAVLNKSGSGLASYTSVVINPGYANIIISASFAGACCGPTGVIQLNKAENITIDGRIGSLGSTNDLTIENTSTGSWSTALFFNGASNNIIRYSNIKSSTTCTNSGVGTVSFMYNSTAPASGCNSNLVEYCNITKSGANMPFVAVASTNTSSTIKSQSNIVRYCTISDFKRYGIWLGNSGIADYNESWTINNNTIYESSGFAIDASVYANHGIYIGYHANGTFTSSYQSGNVTISDNMIGGNGSGGSWTVTGSSSSNFVSGIYVAANTTTYSEINGNTIQNFDVETQYFAGICADKTKLKIGSTSGNTIGSIVLKHPAAAGGTAAGIYLNSSSDYSNEIKNNTIGFSTTTGNNYTNLYGIVNTCSTTHPQDVVSSNSVSNIDATKANTAIGIYAQGYISQNHISKIKYSGSNPLYGIYWMGGRATGLDYRVENNEVILGLDNAGSSTSINSDIYGLFGARQEVVFYYNSVLIQGVATTKNSTCIRLNASGATPNVKNNLLYNERTGGTGKHFCISTAISIAANLVSSNNAYIVGTDVAKNYLGEWNAATSFAGTAKQTLADWVGVATGEVNSIHETTAIKPVVNLLPNAGSSDNLLPFNDKWLCAGCVVSPSTDFVNTSRHNPGPTTIGAYELDCPVLLPIDLLIFSCITIENKNVLLQWSTASEINNDFFTIERSSDCKTFNTIDIIPGAGNSNSILSYQTTDKNPFSGVNYYRLKQTDFDGTSSYSKIISTDISDQDFNISIFPNPFSEYLEINFNDKEVSDIDISVINEMGQEISMTFVKSEINKIRISFPREIPQGNYYIKVKSLDQCRYYKTIKI